MIPPWLYRLFLFLIAVSSNPTSGLRSCNNLADLPPYSEHLRPLSINGEWLCLYCRGFVRKNECLIQTAGAEYIAANSFASICNPWFHQQVPELDICWRIHWMVLPGKSCITKQVSQGYSLKSAGFKVDVSSDNKWQGVFHKALLMWTFRFWTSLFIKYTVILCKWSLFNESISPLVMWES